MKRRLSGWTRLWIVGAVLIWAGGGWWLSENWPHRLYVQYESIACFQAYRSEGGYVGGGLTQGCQLTGEQCERMYRQCMEAATSPEVVARETQEEETNHQSYVREAAALVGAVALAPFALGALAFVVGCLLRWIWRGFRPPPA